MKKPYSKHIYWKTFFSIIFVTLTIFACKKEMTSNSDSGVIKPGDLSQARVWYQTNYPKLSKPNKSHTTSNGSAPNDYSQIIQPNWDKVNQYDRLDNVVLEIPADSAKLLIGVNSNSANTYKPTNGKSSFLLLNNGSAYSAYIMTVIADPNYLNGDLKKLDNNTYRKHDKDFSGVVLYSTPKGEFVSAWIYKNGAITERLIKNRTQPVASRKSVQAVKTNLVQVIETCVDWYQWSYNPDGTPTEPVFLDRICHTYTIDIPSGGGGGSTGGGGSSSGGGGGSPPSPSPDPEPCIPQPVAVNSNGHLKVNLVQPPDGGFPPPETPQPCPVEEEPQPIIIKMDKLKQNFPCAVKLILEKLQQNANYNNLTLPFATVKKPDLVWQNSPLDWNNNGNYKLGETQASGRSAEITLNTSMLQNSSQLMIASTVIHETLHAYINYNIQTYVGGFEPPPSYTAKTPWLNSLSVWATLDGIPSNYRDHNDMMQKYFDSSVATLKAWDNGAHTDKEYAMAMLYGLDNSDFAIMTSNLAQVYSALLTKNNITPSDLQTFWSSQLNSQSNKLPTSGCQ